MLAWYEGSKAGSVLVIRPNSWNWTANLSLVLLARVLGLNAGFVFLIFRGAKSNGRGALSIGPFRVGEVQI